LGLLSFISRRAESARLRARACGEIFCVWEIFEKLLTALKILGNYSFQLVLALFLFYVF
jgi:hypothetical protein